MSAVSQPGIWPRRLQSLRLCLLRSSRRLGRRAGGLETLVQLQHEGSLILFMLLSSRGLGHCPLKAETRVQIPSGVPVDGDSSSKAERLFVRQNVAVSRSVYHPKLVSNEIILEFVFQQWIIFKTNKTPLDLFDCIINWDIKPFAMCAFVVQLFMNYLFQYSRLVFINKFTMMDCQFLAMSSL